MSDDLTRIKDIGPAREKWLNEHGIDTYARLAEVDPNWVCEQLKTEGKPSVLLEVVRGWMEDAGTMTTVPLLCEPSTNVIPLRPITEDGWDDFASFYVAYQHKHQVKHPTLQSQVAYRTIVYRTIADHIEANENQHWDGIEGDDLCHWITKYVNNIIDKKRAEENSISVQPTTPEQESASGELAIEGIEVQDDAGEIVSSVVGASFLPRVLSNRYPLTVTPVLSVSQTNQVSFAWKGTLILYISKMPRGQLVQESQQQYLHFSSIADVYHRHSFQPVRLSSGLYRIQVILWTAEPVQKLAASKEYILQLV